MVAPSASPPTATPPLTAADVRTYVSAALHALVREEQLARRPRRLLDPGHAAWQRFRGRLGLRDFVELLLEDGAVVQPEPFDIARFLGSAAALQSLSESQLADWIAEFARLAPDLPERDYLDLQAKRLGITTRPAYGDLHKLAAHHRVLELPGAGGRLAAHALRTQPDLPFKDMFTIACGSRQERILAGIVTVSLDLRNFDGIAPDLTRATQPPAEFTHVFGIRPDKGGSFDPRRIQEMLHSEKVTIVLV